ncbi:hypothetical protein WISP_98869 [Willisornis vidua]|uniref:Uncharacterized protein n=1 Tax=Willisornis vidua TaxID=1566151 RepID=A0ABQ9CZ78_9PASS|nr:hypothetical protein WISP_98869 [Willisornis vidua]
MDEALWCLYPHLCTSAQVLLQGSPVRQGTPFGGRSDPGETSRPFLQSELCTALNHRVSGTGKDPQCSLGPLSWTCTGQNHRIPKSHTLSLRALSKCFLPNHPLGEEPFPNIQPKSSLTQLHAIALGPVTGHHREEISACSYASSLEDAVDCIEVSPQSPLL